MPFRATTQNYENGGDGSSDRFKLFVGIDWARVSDSKWLTIVNDKNAVLTWFKYPHFPLRAASRANDGRRQAVLRSDCRRAGDSTGQGDMPMEYLAAHSGLPVGEAIHMKFPLQSKNDLNVNSEQAIYRDEGDSLRFSYPLANHPLAAEFEEQMVRLLREYKGDGEYLSVHHPDEPDARDDAPDATGLTLLGAAGGGIGEILFV